MMHLLQIWLFNTVFKSDAGHICIFCLLVTVYRYHLLEYLHLIYDMFVLLFL
jgi:hypothetical protein